MVRRKDLGAGHNGFADWYRQRLSAVLLLQLLPLPLVLLFMIFFGQLDQQALLALLAAPLTRILHSLLAITLLVHAYIGIKVIAEDYVPLAWRLLLLFAVQILALATALGWLAAIWGWGR